MHPMDSKNVMYWVISASGRAYKEFNVVNYISLFRVVKDFTIVVAFSNSSAAAMFHMTGIIRMLCNNVAGHWAVVASTPCRSSTLFSTS